MFNQGVVKETATYYYSLVIYAESPLSNDILGLDVRDLQNVVATLALVLGMLVAGPSQLIHPE